MCECGGGAKAPVWSAIIALCLGAVTAVITVIAMLLLGFSDLSATPVNELFFIPMFSFSIAVGCGFFLSQLDIIW